MFLPQIKLARLISGGFIAHWQIDRAYDYSTTEPRFIGYKYEGIEQGETEFEAIAKSCLMCHVAKASDPKNWVSIKDLPKLRLRKLGRDEFAVDWAYRYGLERGTEICKTQFEAISKAVLMHCVAESRSPDSRDPSDYTVDINDWAVSIKGICRGKIKYTYISESEIRKVNNSYNDSCMIINEGEVSIKQICKGLEPLKGNRERATGNRQQGNPHN